ncbi:beta-glucosidase [Deinococcus sonorensis]|uniref:Glycoside hydrolase family 3 C-terminal domain-containing protein n=2 Tax=Deinococcus sonorensis TaxID=309891 RepID=A0AAU7U5X1_9DEIO
MTGRHLTWDASADVDARVDALLAQLSLDDKVRLVSGQFIRERTDVGPVGLPPFHLADGPAGLRRSPSGGDPGTATALPAPIALAATWSEDLAAAYGDVLGAEAAAAGHTVLLGPAVDIARAPLAGRTFESFGEEPLLHARLVVPEVQAIQRRGVQASLKHYVLNNQEHARNSVDVQASQRALREVYLPPFEAAVRLGHVASIMASYNRADGQFLCANRALLTDVLRGDLGFRGWVVSDFGANHHTAESVHAGLDWELSFAPKWGEQLLQAVQRGEVSEAAVDEMVRRILRPTVGLPPLARERAMNDPASTDVALRVAQQSIVLLKNTSAMLPLDRTTIRRLAVIGADAQNVSAAGGGSALVRPDSGTSVLQAFQQRLGATAEVQFARGVDHVGAGALLPGLPPVPSSVMAPVGEPGVSGWRAEYWPNPTFDGPPCVTRTDALVELNRGFFDFPGFTPAVTEPLPGDLGPHLSVRWRGTFTVPASGVYRFSLTCAGSGRVVFGETTLLEVHGAPPQGGLLTGRGDGMTWDGTGAPVFTVERYCTQGERHDVLIEYAADLPEQNFLYNAQVRFGWHPPDGTLTPDMQRARDLARDADAVVLVARTFESEAMDRPDLTLPNGQEALIRAICAANPRTVVVLMSGGPVETGSWEAGVPAVLEAWFGGQAQGDAVADVVLGEVNPSGRLPLSFPHDAASTPLQTVAQYPGEAGQVHYSEGVHVGYRGHAALNLPARYPFGFGLSYTTFEYSGLALTLGAERPAASLTAAFTLRNAGGTAGTEVAQVYLQRPDSPAVKLVGWARVALDAGEERRVHVRLDPASTERPLSIWNDALHGWEIQPGRYTLHVGSSSADLPCRHPLLVTSFRRLALDPSPPADGPLLERKP